MSISKKGLLIGLCVGIVFGIYFNTTDCVANPHGTYGCDNLPQAIIAGGALFLVIIPYVILIDSGIINPESLIMYKITLFLIPILVFGLVGLIVGFTVNKIKTRLPKN